MSKLILRDIARLRKMPELAQKIEESQPQPDPAEQQLRQLEILKLQKEIAKMDSEIVENYAGAELDQAKARTEGSQADLNDLDFVEQESGVKQEREKELQGEQARAPLLQVLLYRSGKGPAGIDHRHQLDHTPLGRSDDDAGHAPLGIGGVLAG